MLNIVAILGKSTKYLLNTPTSHHVTGVPPSHRHVLNVLYNPVPQSSTTTPYCTY